MILTITDTIVIGLIAALLWLSIFYVYRRFTVDVFRQKMFEIRDELFDFAADGNIEFNNPAYKLLRTTMNGFLRYGHKVGLFELVIIASFTKNELIKAQNISFDNKWDMVKIGLDPELVVKLDTFKRKMHQTIMIQLLMGSPFFACFIIPSIVIIGLKDKISTSIINKLTKPREICLTVKNIVLNNGPNFMDGPINQAQSTAFMYGENKLDLVTADLLAA